MHERLDYKGICACVLADTVSSKWLQAECVQIPVYLWCGWKWIRKCAENNRLLNWNIHIRVSGKTDILELKWKKPKTKHENTHKFFIFFRKARVNLSKASVNFPSGPETNMLSQTGLIWNVSQHAGWAGTHKLLSDSVREWQCQRTTDLTPATD